MKIEVPCTSNTGFEKKTMMENVVCFNRKSPMKNKGELIEMFCRYTGIQETP